MQESLAAPFYELSNDVFPVSAEHGYGIDDADSNRSRRISKPRRSLGRKKRPPARSADKQPDQRRDHRAAQRREIDDAESAGGRRALHRFRHSGNDARRRGHDRRARRAHVPLRGYGRDSPQGQDETRRRKIERDHGAAAPRTGRRRAADRGCEPGSDGERRQHRRLCRGVRPLGDHRDEQVGPGARSRRGKGRARIGKAGKQSRTWWRHARASTLPWCARKR